MNKKVVLGLTAVAAAVVGVLGALSSPVTSAPQRPVPPVLTPVAGGETTVDIDIWRNGQCFNLTVPAKRTLVSTNGAPAVEAVVPDHGAMELMLPPRNPALERPATPAEVEACSPSGPPTEPPPGWNGPMGPARGPNLPCPQEGLLPGAKCE